MSGDPPRDPLRILFVCAARRWTGGERCMVAVAAGLAARGHDVTFSYDPRGPVGARLSPAVRALPIPIRNDLDAPAVLRLARAIRRHDVDVACVNTFRELKIGGAAARLAGGVTVVNRRGSIDAMYDGARERLLYRALLDAIVRDSAAGCRAIREENPWFEGLVLQARNGVDVASLASVEPLPRAGFGAAPDEVVITTMDRPGRLWGSPDLAAACALAATAPSVTAPVRLVVVGDLSAEAEADVRRGLEGAGDAVRLSLPGARPPAEALRLLAASDVFVRVSWTDGIAYAVLEAMALGVPVVASDVGGLSEVLSEEGTGVLVPEGDVPAMGRALAGLAADPGLRARIAAAARARVEREFREERMIDEYEAAFREARAGRRAGAGAGARA